MATLDSESLELLRAIFRELSSNPKGVNAIRFRATHDDRIGDIERLTLSGWIEQQGGFYTLKLGALAEVAGVDPEAEKLLYLCRHIFGHLRPLYKENPERAIPIGEFAKVVDMPVERILRALPYFYRGLTLIVISGDPESDAATVLITEQILHYRSFDDVLDQYRRWANGPDTISLRNDQPSAGTAISGEGTVTRDRTNAAIVIGIASTLKVPGPGPAPEVEDARQMAAWLTSHGEVPSHNLQLITSTIAADGTNVPPPPGVIEQAFIQLHAQRSSWPQGAPLRATKLYIFAAGPGFGDSQGGVSLHTADATNKLLAGIDLTRVATEFTNIRLFDEVILFSDVPRFIGHQGTSTALQFSPRPTPPVGPAAYLYVFSMQKQLPIGSAGPNSIGRPPFTRLAPILLSGLRGPAANERGEVTSHSLGDFIHKEFESTHSEQRPEVRTSSDGAIVLCRLAKSPSDGLERSAPSGPAPAEIANGSSGPADRAVQSIGGNLNLRREADDDELCLNVKGYAAVVAELFLRAGIGEFCFAVYGHWGRGKTRLMRCVGEALGAAEKGYRSIAFSAWKYPSAPEVWVHLYEEFADVAFASPWYRAIPVIVRTGIAKNGVKGLLIGYAAFAVGVIPISHLWTWGVDVLRFIYPIVGIMGMVWLVSIISGVRRTKARLSKTYLTASRHSEKLGLQATIGADLRALLMGWVRTKPSSLTSWIPYWIITLCVLGGTFLRLHDGPGVEQWAQGKLSWSVVGGPSPSGTAATLVALFVLAATINCWLLLGGRETQKVLLIVDDLDRCKPEHLLSVMESIKLLIEDPAIYERVQVAMLLEEDILKHAIYDKYGALADHRRSMLLRTSYDAETIVRENCEKLFTAHLRLPVLGNAELRDLVEVFSGRRIEGAKVKEVERGSMTPQHVADEASEAPPGAASDGGLTGQAASAEEVATNSSDVKSPPQEVSTTVSAARPAERDTAINALRVLEEDEVQAIVTALDDAAEMRRNMGPRAIRAFIFRYQLARLLLQRLSIPWDANALANALVERALRSDVGAAVQPITRDASDEEKLIRVVEQVC